MGAVAAAVVVVAAFVALVFPSEESLRRAIQELEQPRLLRRLPPKVGKSMINLVRS